jgi:TonB family protein
MKTTLYSLLFVLFIFGLNTFAQEEKPDVMPEPVGGIEQILKNVVYPKSAKEAGIEGQVVVKAIIDEKGNVAKTEILKSVTADLDKAAVNAIEKTKFTPAMKDKKPVTAEVVVPVKFKLH